MYFVEWRVLCFDLYFIEVGSSGSSCHWLDSPIIGSSDKKYFSKYNQHVIVTKVNSLKHIQLIWSVFPMIQLTL